MASKSVHADITLLLDMEGVIREATLSPTMAAESVDGWLGRRWSDIAGTEGGDKVRRMVEDARRSGIRSWEDVTTLPKGLREKLAQVVPLWSVTPEAVAESVDGTLKWRLRTHDGMAIESVLIKHARGRRTLCVSSQAGCALGCKFCATGAMGPGRDLTAREIADQAFLAADVAREADVQATVRELRDLDVVRNVGSLLRVIGH